MANEPTPGKVFGCCIHVKRVGLITQNSFKLNGECCQIFVSFFSFCKNEKPAMWVRPQEQLTKKCLFFQTLQALCVFIANFKRTNIQLFIGCSDMFKWGALFTGISCLSLSLATSGKFNQGWGYVGGPFLMVSAASFRFFGNELRACEACEACLLTDKAMGAAFLFVM